MTTKRRVEKRRKRIEKRVLLAKEKVSYDIFPDGITVINNFEEILNILALENTLSGLMFIKSFILFASVDDCVEFLMEKTELENDETRSFFEKIPEYFKRLFR